jgi:hypothetical protein
MTNDRFPTRPDDPAFVSGGITVREYFAAMAMQGFAAKEGSQTQSGAGAAALYAVKYADALIEELNKEAE